jgi:hypothetical protein
VHLAHPLGVKGFTYQRVKTMFATPPALLTCCGWAGCRSRGSRCGWHATWVRDDAIDGNVVDPLGVEEVIRCFKDALLCRPVVVRRPGHVSIAFSP